MFAEYGVLALVGSALAALMLVFVPTVGLYQKNPFLMQQAKYYALLQWLLVGVAFLCLDVAFLSDNFQVHYVAMHSATKLPWFYKACALWGGHEGSMLLWVGLLQTWTLFVSLWSTTLRESCRTRIVVVLGAISFAFLCFILITSNPFITDYQGVVKEGRDLNPLLQDIGFLFHPPMLYIGYVGFSVAFAGAFAMLWEGQWDKACVTWLRPWILASWCMLTLGVTLGSWWAYRELGWGGFWFWDPVENASFMPWLAGCALIHSIMVADKREGLKAWVLLLCIIVFALSLVGTFLVRSGVLTSVHAFAISPQRGLYILVMFVSVILGSLALYAYRAKHFISSIPIYFFSREMTLLLNNVFLMVAMSTVLLGTIYPLIIDGLGLGKLSVGAPYFNTVFIPLMLPLLFLMGFIALKWGENSASTWFRQFSMTFFSLLLVWLIVYYVSLKQWAVGLSVTLSVWVFWTTIKYLFHKPQIRLTTIAWSTAHLGFAVTAIGIAFSTGLGLQKDVVMKAGETIQFAGLPIYFQSEASLTGANYHGMKARFRVQEHIVYPEKRIYDVGQLPMTDAAVDVTWWRDLYIALGDPVGRESWSVRLYYKPLVRWIWFGGIMMFLGGFLACIARARRL